MIDQERFKALLREAIGGRSQQDFARAAGISKYTLSRYLSQGLSAAPRQSTLGAISEASEGRVDVVELLHAAGLHEDAERVKTSREDKTDTDIGFVDNAAAQEKAGIPASYSELAKSFAGNMEKFVRTGIKSRTVAEWLDTFSMLYADTGCRISSCGTEKEYTSEGDCGYRAGSELYSSSTAVWTDLEHGVTYSLPFVLFYCRTQGTSSVPSGIIVRDAAFDLVTLSALDIPEAYPMLDFVSEVEDAKMSDYPLCLTAKETKT